MENESFQIRVLIAVAAILCAVMIGYQVFFTPKVVVSTVIETDGGAILSEIPDPIEENVLPLNLNTASAEELDEFLPGVGPVIAERIVNYREEFGDFKNIEEIKNVSGIGDKTFEKLKNYITV